MPAKTRMTAGEKRFVNPIGAMPVKEKTLAPEKGSVNGIRATMSDKARMAAHKKWGAIEYINGRRRQHLKRDL